MDTEKVKCMADDAGWDVLLEKPDQKLTRFVRDNVRVDVWNSKSGTVAILLPHRPSRYFHYVTETKLEQIFNDPWGVYEKV